MTILFRVFLSNFIIFLIAGFLSTHAQASLDDSEWSYIPDLENTDAQTRDIIGNNVMFYYDDLAHAMHFYGRVLGFKKVWEFEGRVVKYQTSPSSYITLVAKSVGLHRADKPKTFTMSFLTDQLEEWYKHAEKHETLGTIEFHKRLSAKGKDAPYQSFIIKDPEGYLLRFERYTDHLENKEILKILNDSPTLYPNDTHDSWRPKYIGVKASIYWMYYNDLEAASTFFEDVFDGRKTVDEKNKLIYRTSNTGYVGLMRSGHGMMEATADKAATISFLTSNPDPWYKHLKTKPSFEYRADAVVVERDRMRLLVGYGPENHYMEVNGFYHIPSNKTLLDLLEKYQE